MKEFLGTPGPWKFGIRDWESSDRIAEKPFNYSGPGYCDNPSIYGADGSAVVGCDEYQVFSGEADVRLIVAAPDLLEALQEVVAFWDSITMEDHLNDIHVKARAAIAKALGS